jgi:hypothetical protein
MPRHHYSRSDPELPPHHYEHWSTTGSPSPPDSELSELPFFHGSFTLPSLTLPDDPYSNIRADPMTITELWNLTTNQDNLEETMRLIGDNGHIRRTWLFFCHCMNTARRMEEEAEAQRQTATHLAAILRILNFDDLIQPLINAQTAEYNESENRRPRTRRAFIPSPPLPPIPLPQPRASPSSLSYSSFYASERALTPIPAPTPVTTISSTQVTNLGDSFNRPIEILDEDATSPNTPSGSNSSTGSSERRRRYRTPTPGLRRSQRGRDIRRLVVESNLGSST